MSPERGLLWFAPLLAVGAVSWALPAADRRDRWVAAGALAAWCGYFLLTAAWVDWRGGSGYGPRLLLPALPALVVPLARLARRLPGSWRRRLLLPLFTAGFTVGWCAALDPVPAFWSLGVGPLLASSPAAALSRVAVGAALGWLLLSRPPGAPGAGGEGPPKAPPR